MAPNGVIQNWEDMGCLWDRTLREYLGVKDPGQTRVLITAPIANPKASRRRMVQAMFEDHGVGAVAVASPATLALFSQGVSSAIHIFYSMISADARHHNAGLQSGLVVDSGESTSHAVSGGYLCPYDKRSIMCTPLTIENPAPYTSRLRSWTG